MSFPTSSSLPLLNWEAHTTVSDRYPAQPGCLPTVITVSAVVEEPRDIMMLLL